MINLSVLDQTAVVSGNSQKQTVYESLELAQFAERLGYQRYWLAEHHGADAFASSVPELLTARVASVTSTINVGTAGVLLNHYSPYKVAETFRMLATLFPGRIDLGIGRAPGGGPAAVQALQTGPGASEDNHFPQQLADLRHFLADSLPANDPRHGLFAVPKGDDMPTIWLLGSGHRSAMLAAENGYAYSSAHFINAHGGDEVMQAYQHYFRPSKLATKAQGNVCLFVICADTEEQAKKLGATRDLWRLRLGQGIRGPVPSVDEAAAYRYTPQEREQVLEAKHRHIVGTPEQVKQQIEAISEQYGVDDFTILTNCETQARFRSYELLAEVFQLQHFTPNPEQR